MGVKATGYEWNCDWCGDVVETEKRELPKGWIEPELKLYCYDPQQLCSNCPERIRAADLLAHELGKEVARLVKRTWHKTPRHEIPEPFEGIDVKLVGDYAPSLEDQDD